jgi:TatD DNase family protein
LFADTHCHLYFDRFEDDLDDVLERARHCRVERILVPGIDIKSSRQAVEMAGNRQEVFAAVGVHPNDALTWTGNTYSLLEKLTKHQKVCAIGEIGLDYYWDTAPHELQRMIFEEQLNLALRNALPVVIHLRDKDQGSAFRDALSIVHDWISTPDFQNSPLKSRPGVLHSFSGDLETAFKAIDLGFFLGITGPVTFKTANQLRQIVQKVPLETLLIETDAPFLTPVPYRGRRNEPAYVKYVADEISRLRNQEYVCEQLYLNAERLFRW